MARPLRLTPPPPADGSCSSTANPLAGPLQQLGIQLSPRAMLVLEVALVVVPLLLAAAAAFYVWWRARKAAPKAPTAGAGGNVVAQVEPGQLRDAWKRFLKQLPPLYQRSILNFEHFVVLGAQASGKSRVIDSYSDWRRQAKQLSGSLSHDPDLPTYLASGLVITELPARFLTDHSPRAQAALRNLWGPLYKRRAPTVVLVIDVQKLGEATAEAVQELAESARAKINLLSSIRSKPLEVRVVLTHLDAIEGYGEFAGFCRDENIPTQVDLEVGETPIDGQLKAALDRLRDHLPRALTRLPSSDYLKVVSFLRRAPELVPGIAKLLTVLFAKEALSHDPLCGGVYMAAEPASVSNPLEHAAESGPGPDPRRVHLLVTAAIASAMVAYLGAAYQSQRSAYQKASDAVHGYVPSTKAEDIFARRTITAFTSHKLDFIDAHPDYFAKARTDLRKKLSDKIRDEMLIRPLLRGTLPGASDTRMSSPTRQRLYFLALVHSDKGDALGIDQPGNIDRFTRLTTLPQDLIEDYLHNTDGPFKSPIGLDPMSADTDVSAHFEVYPKFLRDVSIAIDDGVISPQKLRELQAQAMRLEAMLPAYADDERTAPLLEGLDRAAGTLSGERDKQAPLRQAYGPLFDDYVASVRRYRLHEQTEQLKKIMQVVKAGAVDAKDEHLLKSLVERLEALRPDDDDTADPSQTVTMGELKYTFEPKKWRALLRKSTGQELISQFVRTNASAITIFFGGDRKGDLPDVVYNPSNDGTAIFTGRGKIDGWYTKRAYDEHVRAVVIKMNEVLEKASVTKAQRKTLEDFVYHQVKGYATEYRNQLFGFTHAFGVRAQSQEALRVAVAQMARTEGSTFIDFLHAIEENSLVDHTDSKGLLVPMRDVAAEFEGFRKVAGGASPEVNKYQAILTQLLGDLGPGDGAAPAAAQAPQGPETLERALSPAGRLVLAEVRGEKGSYGQMVREWVNSISPSLPDYQRAPFLAPIHELTRLGRRDIEQVVANAYENELLPDIRRLSTRFPFDLSSNDDISPGELTAVLHPQTGRYFDVFRRYFEPLSDFGDGGPFRPKASVRGRVTLPPHLHDLTNVVAVLSARLWDQTGKPLPLSTRVATVPFEHGRNPKLALTLVYLNAGPAPLFNFNQKPAQVTINLDWSKEQASQVGLQLTDVETKDNVFPDPVSAGGYWSFLRLLQKGQGEPAKYPPGAQLYTWTFKIGREGADTMPGQFVVVDDLFSLFNLGTFVRTRLHARVAQAGK